MPVSRCPLCHRGRAGYMDGEKNLHDLTDAEVVTEIRKLEAKEIRLRNYIENLRLTNLEPQMFPEGVACPSPRCQQGWREFQDHRKDLEQLTATAAIAALGANSNYLIALLERIV